ncbi:MAG: Gfo/Idh/MocA family oxidoreductase [Anaerolineae bacterium]|nr:Gfo/Idh/MocA family oxidoreductase [Anaerolineae bacterium]
MSDLNLKQTAELPSTPLPIVSIGMGGIVDASHYPAYQIAGFPIVGGYDLNPQQAQKMAQKYNVPQIYSSVSEAIANAPANAIFDLAVPGKAVLDILAQIPAGRGVLIQKPMGDTLEEASAILALCREKRLIAAINFQLRFAPFIIAARDLIARGMIGELWDMEARVQVYTPWSLWSFLKGIPRLEVLYHSIHYLDLIRSFLGDPQRVYAKCIKHPIFEEYAGTRSTIILDYGERVRVQVSTNHSHIYGQQKQESYIKWEGSKGAIQTRMGVNMDYPTGIPDLFEYNLLEDQLGWRTAEIDGTWFPHAFIGTMASLQRFVLGESDVLPTSVEDAIKTMATVEAAYISSAEDGTPLPAV